MLLLSLDCSANFDPYFIMLSVKQGGIKYHFLSFWYDSTWYFAQLAGAVESTDYFFAEG